MINLRHATHATEWETRARDGVLELTGIAVPYGEETVRHSGGGYELREVFPGGGYSPYRGDVVGMIAHDRTRPLARLSKRTLELDERKTELGAQFRLPEKMPDARNVYEGVGSGAFGGLSVGFIGTDEHYEDRREDGRIVTSVREVRAFDLVELSFVAIPAYAGATVDQRDMQAWQDRLDAQAERNNDLVVARPEPRGVPFLRSRLRLARAIHSSL